MENNLMEQHVETIWMNEKEYKILCLLGKGKGGYSYLVQDGTCEYVIKKIHHEPCSYYQFGNKLESEQKDYERLTLIGIRMPMMYEVDEKAECIRKQYIKGETIYDMVKKNQDVSVYVNQVKKMCELLYAANTNIDYFPTNFVVQDGIAFYIDYECNNYMEEWNFENWGIKYWSKTKEFLEYEKQN